MARVGVTNMESYIRGVTYKPALEALLLDGILRHDKFFIAEAHLVFGEGHVIVIL